MTTNISEHYEAHSNDSYESAFFYLEGEYTKWLCDLVRETFALPPAVDSSAADNEIKRKRRILLDVGGGTGNFTSMVINDVDYSMDAIVVDPFLPASSSGNANDNDNDNGGEQKCLQFVKASAEEFIPPGHHSIIIRMW